jgi:magnesium chelatase subunit I
VRTPTELAQRVLVVRRRDAFERDPAAFTAEWHAEDERVRKRIVGARKHLNEVRVDDALLERAAMLCMALGTDGLRGELTLMRAARALAALDGDRAVADAHLKRAAKPALRHRLRRDPLDDTDAGARVDRAIQEVFGA